MMNKESVTGHAYVIKDGECCKTDQRFFDVENEPLAVFLP
jgi:hypothetical protein